MKYNSLSRKGLIDVEKEIINLYDQHLSIKEICDKLNIGKSTVHNYIKKNNKRRYRLHSFCDNSFSIFTPESCYWAGFIAADGCVDNRNTHIRVELHFSDIHHIKKLLSFVKDANKYIVEEDKVAKFENKTYFTKSCRADINSVKIVNDLVNNFNITPAKSFTIKPPNKIPKELIHHYIRGYFDGDGSIYWSKSGKCTVFQISSGSKELLDWISVNVKEQVNYRFSNKALSVVSAKSIYYIRSSHNLAKSIFNWLYSDSTTNTRLDRKYERYLEHLNTYRQQEI